MGREPFSGKRCTTTRRSLWATVLVPSFPPTAGADRTQTVNRRAVSVRLSLWTSRSVPTFSWGSPPWGQNVMSTAFPPPLRRSQRRMSLEAPRRMTPASGLGRASGPPAGCDSNGIVGEAPSIASAAACRACGGLGGMIHRPSRRGVHRRVRRFQIGWPASTCHIGTRCFTLATETTIPMLCFAGFPRRRKKTRLN